MKIGKFQLYTLCRLAPMAGISNIPFRLLCKELGSSLTTSEEISAKALSYKSAKTMAIAAYLPEEKPIAMQIFGSEPQNLADAAKILADLGADIIDLNMGCPVNKIVKTGAGSALMRDPLRAAEIFRAIRSNIAVPFTIKIRGGWDDNHINAPEIARVAESEGVDAIAVHPRTRSQQYAGVAPWEVIKQVVESVKIPVTGNGDVKSYKDAIRMQKETGCQSVMIGRGALGSPWIFDPEFSLLSENEQFERKGQIIQRHMELIRTHLPEHFGFLQMKKHLAWYAVGRQGASQVRQKIFAAQEIQELLDLFTSYWVGALKLESETLTSEWNSPSDSFSNC